MTPPDLSLKQVFAEAIDRPPGPEREAYLDQACLGNLPLRGQVEGLLRSYEAASQFLQSVAVSAPDGGSGGDSSLGAASAGPPVVFRHPDALISTADAGRTGVLEGPGTIIGPYKLLQKLGEGGMGVVFMAEQDRPIRRKVALKVIKPGMDTRQVIARFEAERQALAMMDHAQIARVLDVGATATGRPYFVMELVRGVPITDYCERNHLTPRERLELFLPVCRAIQHAHQKGIIHRDIKPTNVLVTLRDGVPEPKVIDFGVAKAVEQRLTERTMFTEFGAIIGTLEYMSPEQAEMGALDIDTRSDIYSLGVLLYELLTGSTPLERAKVRDAAYSEVLRRIREEEPPRPSTRLSGSKTSPSSISAQRKIEPARLSQLVRGDLDWIVMKALEKDRTRRYETAAGLARDIQRHLDGETVEACPPSTTYRLRKLARRHRAALITATSFATLLIASTVISTSLAIWANRARLEARRSQDRIAELLDRAKKGEKTAIKAVKQFVDVVRDTDELKYNQSLAPLRKSLLAEPRAFFQELHDRLLRDGDGSPEAIAELAAATYELGALSSEVDRKEVALDRLIAARALWSQLYRRDPKNRRVRAELARSEAYVGLLQTDLWRYRDALASQEAAQRLLGDLLDDGVTDEPTRKGLALTLHAIGHLQVNLKRHDLALAAYKRALPLWRRLDEEDPEQIRYRGDLTYCLTQIGTLQPDRSRWLEALAAYEQSLPVRKKLADDHPTSVWHGLDLASNQYLKAQLELMLGRPAEALASYEQDTAMWDRLVHLDPINTRYRKELARTWNLIGDLRDRLKNYRDAADAYHEALKLWEPLHGEDRNDREYAEGLARSLIGLARLDEQDQHLGEAGARLRRVLDLLRANVTAAPQHVESWNMLRDSLSRFIRVAKSLDHPAEADDASRELAELLAHPPPP